MFKLAIAEHCKRITAGENLDFTSDQGHQSSDVDSADRSRYPRCNRIDTDAYFSSLDRYMLIPSKYLLDHYFSVSDLSDIERGIYPDPKTLADLIKGDARYPFGWNFSAAIVAINLKPRVSECPFAALASQGLELSPEDVTYVRNMTAGMSPQKLGETLGVYARIWNDAMSGNPVHQQQNAGRMAANNWLRNRHIFR